MLAVSMDNSDIPGFARSDIFLSESDMKACGFRDIIFAVLTAAGNITMQSIISLSEGQYHSPPGEYN